MHLCTEQFNVASLPYNWHVCCIKLIELLQEIYTWSNFHYYLAYHW